MKDLSIIIVCYKGWERLRKCLNSLNAFTGKSFSYEVIIVDNNSGDQQILEIEKEYSRFIFLHNTINGGFGNGCNLGAIKATGEYLLFLNPDTVSLENEIGKLLNNAGKSGKTGIFSCRQINENGRESVAFGFFPSILNLTGLERAIFKQKIHSTEDHKIIYPDWVSGSVIMIKNDAFFSIGQFDEDFWMYFEDVDLCRRMRNKGGEVAFFNDIVIEHNHGGSSRINSKTASLTKTEVLISRHIYISKHKKGTEKLLIQIFLIINNIITSGLTALAGILLFFIPRMFVRSLVFFNLIVYYMGSISKLSWISPRSANFSTNLLKQTGT